MQLAQTILLAMAVYSTVGTLFALAFVTVGAGQIDPAARGTRIGFRLLIFPASVALWPVLAAKWWGAAGTEKEHSS